MELVLQSLSLGKKTEGASTRVLTRVRSGDQKQDKTVLLTDEFVVNRKFRNNLHKVKIPQIANKLEEEAEEKKAHVRNPYPRPPPRASPQLTLSSPLSFPPLCSVRLGAQESVKRDRMHTIDACVVRIMKTRKTLKHQELISEVLNQLRWQAEASDIKKRIESLIEREYLERSDTGKGYNYLA